jgi:hypothetical protein
MDKEGSSMKLPNPAERTAPNAVFDTREGVVHVPERSDYPYGVENLTDFVAWLNDKAKTDRFLPVTATAMRRRGRAGMTRRYAEFLKGAPDVRIRDALQHVLRLSSQSHRGVRVERGPDGDWRIPDAVNGISAIAEEAKVSFADAHAAFLALLRHELGDVMDRVTFPPATAVTPASPEQSDDDPYPVDL